MRCPLIPGLNDRSEHLTGIAGLANQLQNVIEVHVLPYHPLGTSKSQRLGKTPALPNVPAPDAVQVSAWLAEIQSQTGVPVRRD